MGSGKMMREKSGMITTSQGQEQQTKVLHTPREGGKRKHTPQVE
jgi:hypothetical protein